jgi:hypothetical protein
MVQGVEIAEAERQRSVGIFASAMPESAEVTPPQGSLFDDR